MPLAPRVDVRYAEYYLKVFTLITQGGINLFSVTFNLDEIEGQAKAHNTNTYLAIFNKSQFEILPRAQYLLKIASSKRRSAFHLVGIGRTAKKARSCITQLSHLRFFHPVITTNFFDHRCHPIQKYGVLQTYCCLVIFAI